MALWPAAHERPHLQVGYMAAPTITCKSERNPLPTESRPYTAPDLPREMISSLPCTDQKQRLQRVPMHGSSSLCVVHPLLATVSLWAGMRMKSKWSPGPGVKILGVALTDDDGWVVSAAGSAIGICPDCGRRSRSRHGWSRRSLQDLPVQGKPVTVKLLLSRWRCPHQNCERRTFTDRLPTVAAPHARRTRRVRIPTKSPGHSEIMSPTIPG